MPGSTIAGSSPRRFIRSTFARRKQIRFQVWSPEEFRTYWSRPGDLDLTGTGSHRFDWDESESGENTLKVIPFQFFHNDHPTDTFWTPGIGRCLAETSFACDSVLSDLQQNVSIHFIPTRYGKNLSVNARLIDRPGNIVSLTPTDDAKDCDVFFRQPDLAVEEIWLHVQNTVNSDLSGLGIPIRVELDTSGVTQPESGLRWQSDGLCLPSSLASGAARSSTRSRKPGSCAVATVAAVGAGVEGLESTAAGLELELDYPDLDIPIPSPERDAQDLFEIEQGCAARSTSSWSDSARRACKAVEHLRRVKADQAELAALGVGPAAAVVTPGAELSPHGDDGDGDGPDSGGQQGGEGPDVGPDNSYQGSSIRVPA